MDLVFFLKKYAAKLLFPIPLVLELLLLGLLLRTVFKRPRAGNWVMGAGLFLFLLFSTGLLTGPLLGSLEQKYPVFDPARHPDKSFTSVVVLAGGAVNDPDLPPNSRLFPASLARLVEGVRIYKELDNARLVLSGWGWGSGQGESEFMAQTAIMLGADPSDLFLEKQSTDTAEQAEFLSDYLFGQEFILVTSASHMPRSMTLFRFQNLTPTPAPTDFEYSELNQWTPRDLIPSAENLRDTERAFHEYLGLAWESLRR